MKKAQVGIETLFLLAFITLMVIPATYLFYQYMLESTDDIIQNRVQTIGKSFVENANLVYNYGKKAKIEVKYSFPGNILNMTIDNDYILVFNILTNDGAMDVPFPFGINVTGYFNESTYSEGDKTFEFKTQPGGDSVSIRMV